MYKMSRFLLSTFPDELSNGWYVTTTGALFNVPFLDLLLDTCENLTFLFLIQVSF